MSDTQRYQVYKPVAEGKWQHLFGADSVKKENGALEQLEDTIKTGPDARIAVVIDTKNNSHVMIFRMNVQDRTTIKPLPGGWKEGDANVLANVVDPVAEVAKAIAKESIENNIKQTAVKAVESVLKDEVVTLESDYDYPDQPDYVVLSWMQEPYDVRMYAIARPTEKQLRVLTLANTNFLGGGNSAKIDGALMRIIAAISTDPEHCTGMIEVDKGIKQWVGIWKEAIVAKEDGTLRFEGNTVEFVYCGHLV